jgi:hypothetical protein
MTDPTNDINDIDDIDALVRDLGYAASIGHLPWRHAALTALVAERDGLLKRVVEQDADIKTLAASNAILHGRLESHPPADRDRELRERLVCALIVPAFELYSASRSVDPARYTVSVADAVIAAMRNGGGA